jgi:calcineurin-like phosphoesterase family protein
MSNYIIGDHHFGHFNILGFAQRPWTDINKMDTDLVKLHNSVVGPDDTTYVLGEVTLRGAENVSWLRRIIHKMNGAKILIFGNHDKMQWEHYLDAGFQSVHSYLSLGSHAVNWGTVKKFSEVVLCHDPAGAQDKTKLWICAHLHNCAFRAPTHIAIVSAELVEYKPVLVQDIVDGLRPGEGVLRTPPRSNREPKEWSSNQKENEHGS